MSIFAELSSNGGALESSVPLGSEAPASATATTLAVTNPGQIWTITAEVDLYIEFGSTPNGSGTPRRRMKAGTTRQFIAQRVGEKVAWSAS